MNRAAHYASLVTAVIALALTWHTVRATPMATVQIRRKCADLKKLHALQASTDQAFSAMKMLQDAGAPPELAELLANRNPEVRPRRDAPLIEGWFLKSADVIFDDIALADLASIMADAENARPPWRVAECAITPSGVSGFGRAALVLETIVLKSP